MANHDMLDDINSGDSITAEYLRRTTRALNANTRAIRAPREVLQVSEELQQSSGGATTEVLGNEVFSSTVTESDQIVTDNAGDELTLKRVDTIVCTETTTGRTMTINITYA